ncbi:MAG: SOS response-associated peptidase [Chloroflexi bacterium]|nr:SOS response-associated peptidase [Chloroflexota bacterium]
MTQQTSPSDLARMFDAEVLIDDAPLARFNCAPTDPLNVILERDDDRLVERHRWGLIPTWAKDRRSGARRINARAETVADSPSFRAAFRKRRCIVPADGFYEWRMTDTVRQPWHIRRRDSQPMAMAGLWSVWRDAQNGVWMPSCSVITTTAVPRLAALHDRMPVLLEGDIWSAWLSADANPYDILAEVLATPAADGLELWPVSRLVNDVRNEGPELIRPIVADALDDGHALRLAL